MKQKVEFDELSITEVFVTGQFASKAQEFVQLQRQKALQAQQAQAKQQFPAAIDGKSEDTRYQQTDYYKQEREELEQFFAGLEPYNPKRVEAYNAKESLRPLFDKLKAHLSLS